MKAIVCTKYGSPDVLQLKEVEKPVPGDKEILIRVVAASVTAADSMMRRGTPYYARLFVGIMKPTKPIPGTGFAGDVEAVGKGVSLFKIGDAVFGETGMGFSANAEYVCIPESGVLSALPGNISYAEAAPVSDGALTSLSFLKDIQRVQKGQSVLINGASGSLGSAAVQIAKYLGAEVTAVCSTANVEMVKSLGADKVIDYTQQDFTRSDQPDQVYDIIYDTVGKLSFSGCKRVLKPNGIYLSPVLSTPLLFQMLWTSRIGSRKAKFSATGIRPAAELRILLEELKSLFEAGKICSFIDRYYPLEQVPEAHRYVDKGHKRGNVIIAIGRES